MKFLESPDLGDPKEVWVDWLSQLKTMDRRDESVKFALRRAEAVIAELESLELA